MYVKREIQEMRKRKQTSLVSEIIIYMVKTLSIPERFFVSSVNIFRVKLEIWPVTFDRLPVKFMPSHDMVHADLSILK